MIAAPKCIMLIDDDDNDNFFHEREIRKYNAECAVVAKNSGPDALEYLRQRTEPLADLIFLDINMPEMTGWEFLSHYDSLDNSLKSRAVIVILTTSELPNDRKKIQAWQTVADYITKPLTNELLLEIINKFFSPRSN